MENNNSMTIQELELFISESVPVFANLEIIGEGFAFHYTPNYNSIVSHGSFLGAPIDENLDQTQITLYSLPAIHDPGVVFAYLDENDAREEGFGDNMEIVKISFSAALKATHSQEAVWTDAPATILILTTDILNFEKCQ